MISYRLAEIQDLPSIAKLYKEGFPNSIYALLSNKLRTTYCSAFLSTDFIVTVATNQKNSIIAFITSFHGTNRDFEIQFKEKYRFQLLFNLIWNFIKLNPVLYSKIYAWIKNRLKKSGPASFPNRLITHNIEYVVVTKEYQGTKVASSLLKKHEEMLIEHSICEYALTVRNNNLRAKFFYLKNGLIEIFSNSEYSYLVKKLK